MVMRATIGPMDANAARTENIRRWVQEAGGPTAWANRYGGTRWSAVQANQWISATSPKGIGRKLARDIEAAMGKAHGEMDRPDESQTVTLGADKLGIALVAVERAIRAKGLDPEETWGKLAKLVIWAVALQERHYPSGVTDLRGFDAQVLLEMDRGSYGFEGDGQAAAGRIGGIAEPAAARKKARGREKGRESGLSAR